MTIYYLFFHAIRLVLSKKATTTCNEYISSLTKSVYKDYKTVSDVWIVTTTPSNNMQV